MNSILGLHHKLKNNSIISRVYKSIQIIESENYQNQIESCKRQIEHRERENVETEK
jgi:hypothetical protein